MKENSTKTRLDKWLWAARWFKTRALATAAIKGGKVHVNNRTVKPAYSVSADDLVTITQGPYKREILVLGLGGRRGPATEAAKLYAETDDSLARNEQIRLTLKAQPTVDYQGSGRPTKRARRAIIRFTDHQD
ncbi:MAG: RNA-binding protein [Gammaproteobacteria bacterium]|nr:MAG: RNA-binding protein [Gammaproteobacteria bacterium]